MKLTLTLELVADDEALVHPRIAGALVDYAAAVIANNQAMFKSARIGEEPSLVGEPPVGLSHDGVLKTAHGVTVREGSLE